MNEIGERLRKIGGEYGATTGRPRRCGWFDLPALKYSIRINGIQKLVITKLDVLDDFDEILVCTGYQKDGIALKHFPTDAQTLEKVQLIYKSFYGWKEKISDVKRYKDLPIRARKYIDAISRLAGIPVWLVSVGARRGQTLKT